MYIGKYHAALNEYIMLTLCGLVDFEEFLTILKIITDSSIADTYPIKSIGAFSEAINIHFLSTFITLGVCSKVVALSRYPIYTKMI